MLQRRRSVAFPNGIVLADENALYIIEHGRFAVVAERKIAVGVADSRAAAKSVYVAEEVLANLVRSFAAQLFGERFYPLTEYFIAFKQRFTSGRYGYFVKSTRSALRFGIKFRQAVYRVSPELDAVWI